MNTFDTEFEIDVVGRWKSEYMWDINSFYTEYNYYVLYILNTYNTMFIFTQEGIASPC